MSKTTLQSGVDEIRAPTLSLIQRLIARPEFGPFILLVVEIAVFALRSPTFLSTGNISNPLAFTPELGMIALAMTMLMTSGEFDLSVGSVFGFAPIIVWTFYNTGAASLEVGFVIAMLLAVLIGLTNGLFVTRLRITSFLVTLGMQTQTKTGNWIQAAGGNANSARARGVRVSRTEVALFILTAALVAYAGITSSIRVQAANPNSGTGYELEVIAMVVIGGTALTGGRGTIIGTVIGVLILRMMRNGIVMVGVPGLAYNIFIGAIILGMALPAS